VLVLVLVLVLVWVLVLLMVLLVMVGAAEGVETQSVGVVYLHRFRVRLHGGWLELVCCIKQW
jgi:hypothetical protein